MSDKIAKSLRARADDRALLRYDLNDGEARVATIIMHHIADAMEDKPVRKMVLQKVVKRQHV